MKTASLPIWSSATLTSSISSGFTTATASESWKPRSYERSNPSCSNSAMVIAGQKRIRVDDEDFYIELLLYHRKLRRLVAVDLKLEKEFPFRKLEPRFKAFMERFRSRDLC
jgi:hypothetical protein